MNMKKIFLAAVAAGVLYYAIAAPSAASGAPGDLVAVEIVHTNDTHGYFQRNASGGSSAADAVARAKSAAAAGAQVIMLDAGDLMGKTWFGDGSMASDLERMAKIGYDAVALGNNDAAFGIDNLAARSKALKLPVVCANLVRRESGEPVFPPYIVRNVGGIRVGVMGLTTPDTFEKLSGEDRKNFTVTDPEEAYSKVIDGFKKDCDFRVLLSHMGTVEDEKFAKKHSKIKVIVGGHTPDALKTPLFINSACVVNTGRFGANIGIIEIKLERESGEVVNMEGRLKSVGR